VTFSRSIFSFSLEISRFPSVACYIIFLQCGSRLNSLKLGASLLHHLSVWSFPPRIPAFPRSWTWPGLVNSSCNRVTLAEGLARSANVRESQIRRVPVPVPSPYLREVDNPIDDAAS
jgi:hypothetical protein